MKCTESKKTKPWFGGGAVGFILSKPIVTGKKSPNEIPAKINMPGDDTNKKSNTPNK